MPSDLWRLVFAAALTICLLGAGSLARAQQGPVKADSGGIAIGGNVEHSCIGDCSIRPEQFQALIQQSKDLSDAQKKIIAGLERDLELNRQQVQAALQILGEANVSKSLSVSRRSRNRSAQRNPAMTRRSLR